jgi:nucleoside-diphosphate-sugar epimerase
MTIFATGITGTIGRHLRDSAISLNLDLASKYSKFEEKLFKPGDSYLHLAGIVGPANVEKDPGYSFRVNVEGVIQLGEEFLKSSYGKFVFVSTSHVYSASECPISETHLTNPRNLYSQQKLIAELALLEMFSASPDRLCVVRVFSVLDWDVAPFTLGGGIRKLMDEKSDYVLTNCDDIRDFLTPRKIAETLARICETPALSGLVNLCSGEGITVGQAAKEMLGPNMSLQALARMRAGQSDCPTIVGDNTKLRKALPDLDLRWSPSTSN